MSEKKDCVPKIRFTGFADSWKQRKFDELVFRESVTCDKYGLPRVEYEDIISGQGQLNKDISEKKSNKKGILFQAQDILFGKLRPYLQNWLLANFCGIAVGDFWVLRPNEMNPKFIYNLIQSVQFQRVSNLSMGTKMPRSDWNVVSKAEFAVPVDEIEQAKMGAFFDHLDNLITLYQREHDNTVNIKKSMLEKMFPKNGMDKPEIRFAGFTDAWEQRKLGELGSVVMNRRIFKEQTSENGEIPFYKIGTFGGEPDAFISREVFEEYKVKYPYPEIGDILISASGSIGRIIEYSGKDEYFQDSNIVWLKHDERIDNSFLKYFYSIVKWQGLEGSTIKRLYNKNILETNISLPAMTEQSQIGTFFTTLDRLITLHQRELTKLQNMKKSLLEKMFI